MNVVMVHPVHGAKVAINEIELAQDEKNGWTRYNADTPKQAAQDESEPVVEVETEAEADVEVEPVVETEPVVEVKHKRKNTRGAKPPVEQPNDVPDFLASVSDESEGS